jgi:hypothetical protein
MSMEDIIRIEITRELVEKVFGSLTDTKWADIKAEIETSLTDIAWEDIEDSISN